MKKFSKCILLLIALGFIFMYFLFCQKSEPISLCVYSNDGESVHSLNLAVDLNCRKLTLNSSPLYGLKVAQNDVNLIFPQYMTRDILVLGTTPESSAYKYTYTMTNRDTFYYDDYTLIFNRESHTARLMKSGVNTGDLDLTYQSGSIKPASFFVDSNGDIIILGMVGSTLEESELVVAHYTETGSNLWGMIHYHEILDIWSKYDLSKVNCPTYTKGSPNVAACGELGGFLYNEGENLLYISSDGEKVTNVLTPDTIEGDMPFLDTHREFYGFFSDFTYQDGYYIASFPSYNYLEGMYVAFYQQSGKYSGCLLCTRDKLILFDSNNKVKDSIDMSLLPIVYLPDFNS